MSQPQDVLGQLYQHLGVAGAMHDQVLEEMRELAAHLQQRDAQLVTARLHAEQSDDAAALKEISDEQDELARAWKVLREHLGDELDEQPDSGQKSP